MPGIDRCVLVVEKALQRFKQGEFVQGIAAACLELLGDKQQLIQKAQPATKRNRCGYSIQQIVSDSHLNLAKLMAGSEGTLAVFSEMTLRTVPVPSLFRRAS